MSHSKRNTSRSVFTSHERSLAKAAWASNSARLHRDSFLPFGSCCLCLEVARDPIACSHGDIFCRECAISNLLAQKKEIKRTSRTRERLQAELHNATMQQAEEAQQRATKHFELMQTGLSPSHAGSSATAMHESRSGTKRKFMHETNTEEEEGLNLKRVAKFMSVEDTPSTSWTPSQDLNTETLQKAATLAKNVKSEPICPASPADALHRFALKTFRGIMFTEEATHSNTETRRRICPSCMKTLSNASKPLMAVTCGHVLCRACLSKFTGSSKSRCQQQPQTCFVCDQILTPGDKGGYAEQLRAGAFRGLIELRSEGTGFSARGGNKIQKEGVAFQC